MGVYSSTEVYPCGFDEIDLTLCENCDFDCWTHECCIKEQK